MRVLTPLFEQTHVRIQSQCSLGYRRHAPAIILPGKPISMLVGLTYRWYARGDRSEVPEL